MTQTKQAPTVDELAPYPADQVTADKLARHLAVSAWRTWADIPRLLHAWEAAGKPATGPELEAFLRASQAASAEYVVAYLLRKFGGSLTPDELAEANLPYAGDVDWAIDHLEAWMHEWGIDADALERLLAEAKGTP